MHSHACHAADCTPLLSPQDQGDLSNRLYRVPHRSAARCRQLAPAHVMLPLAAPVRPALVRPKLVRPRLVRPMLFLWPGGGGPTRATLARSSCAGLGRETDTRPRGLFLLTRPMYIPCCCSSLALERWAGSIKPRLPVSRQGQCFRQPQEAANGVRLCNIAPRSSKSGAAVGLHAHA